MAGPAGEGAAAGGQDQRIVEFQQQLFESGKLLQTTRQEYQISLEELACGERGAAEHQRRISFRLEELEISKEELQSMNEELQLVNQELKVRMEEIAAANGDLQNLFAATEYCHALSRS